MRSDNVAAIKKWDANTTDDFVRKSAPMRAIVVAAGVVAALLLAGPALAAEPCNSASFAAKDSANDITFSFDDDYSCGQFANGDWWVIDEGQGVTITDISPASSPGRHGWESNPSEISSQPYDDRISSYTDQLQPDLPYAASAGESIVKSVSVSDDDTNCRPCLQFAAVLTVVDTEPAADALRPPYFGDDKPIYRVEDVDTDRLPRLDSSCCDEASSFDGLAERYRRVQLDHKTNWSGRHMHPVDNMPDYGASIARNAAVGALRFMLDDFDFSEPGHRQALINYLQMGVDLFGMVEGGMNWHANGGHLNGRKLPVTFAGILLGAPEIQAAAGSDVYSENDQVFFSPEADDGAGMSLYGMPCSESEYWNRMRTGSGNRACRDPYGYIDGGSAEIGGAYQSCCTANPWRYTALAVRLMWAEPVFDYDPLLDYVDRLDDVGVWASPDPCAPYDGEPDNYGVTYGPDGNGGCIQGGGRFPDKHGEDISGNYGNGFGNQMLQAFKACTPDCPGQEHLDDAGGEDAGADVGADAGPAEDVGSGEDVGQPDASASDDAGEDTGDAGPGTDTGTGAGSDASAADAAQGGGLSEDEGGCSCRQSPSSPAPHAALIVVVLAAALALRRRRSLTR
jgi:MYXO-CTERM domain-containing protein